MDLRIQRTRKSLISAFYNLLLEKKYENISVTDICNVAMVRKATFYQHFEDKFHLMNYLISELQKIAKEETINDSSLDYYLSSFNFLLTFVEKYKLFIGKIIDGPAWYITQNILVNKIKEDLDKKFSSDENLNLKENHDLLSTIASSMMVSTATWWLKVKKCVNKDYIINVLKDSFNKFPISLHK